MEGTGAAIAVFSPEGKALGASARFLMLSGVSRLPQDAEPEALLDRLGFEPLEDGPGWFRCAGRLVRPRIERISNGFTLLFLEENPELEAQHRSRFLSIAAHDLRGPMANVRGYTSFLLDSRPDLDPKARRSLETVLRNADRALVLLREVFDSTQADYRPLELLRERQELMPLLQPALEEAWAQAGEKGATVMAKLPESLPEAMVDKEALGHIFSAFLSHGVSRAGQGQEVEVSARVEDGELEVAVADQGPTLTDEEALHAYDRDHRTVREGKLAAGFRLSLARAEVEAHGGAVGVQRLPGRTVFFFTLPLD